LPDRRIVRALDHLVAAWGKPATIVSGDGTELTCNAPPWSKCAFQSPTF